MRASTAPPTGIPPNSRQKTMGAARTSPSQLAPLQEVLKNWGPEKYKGESFRTGTAILPFQCVRCLDTTAWRTLSARNNSRAYPW
jgi:hypothetical protein